MLPLRNTWLGMIARCYNPKHVSYRFYGAKGVRVCDRWMHSFDAFREDVGARPSTNHSLDRHPHKSGNYEPGNVRWATRIEQSNNTIRNVIIEHLGEKLTLPEWSRRLGIQAQTIRHRMKAGVPVELLFSEWRVYGGAETACRIATHKEQKA